MKLLLLFAVTLLAGAQATAPTSPRANVKPEDKCRIEGTVANSISSEPPKKAQLGLHSLTAQNGTSSGATTDASGHYVIENIDPGRYPLLSSPNELVPRT